MPELPEVETTKQGITPYLNGKTISQLVVRQRQLRWKIPDDIEAIVKQQKVHGLERRGKYILIYIQQGALLIHLGMSGSLRIADRQQSPDKHDHYDLVTKEGKVIRYHDPRKFGCLLYQHENPHSHPLLCSLGVEPLSAEFDGDYLYRLSRGRRVAIKQFIMDSKIVVGVGNIYASEALFTAGIHPLRSCARISMRRMQILAETIKITLENAIQQGGTTLRDFLNPEAKPGYFQQALLVYNREGQDCRFCHATIRRIVQTQRSTFYCPLCQR